MLTTSCAAFFRALILCVSRPIMAYCTPRAYFHIIPEGAHRFYYCILRVYSTHTTTRASLRSKKLLGKNEKTQHLPRDGRKIILVHCTTHAGGVDLSPTGRRQNQAPSTHERSNDEHSHVIIDARIMMIPLRP